MVSMSGIDIKFGRIVTALLLGGGLVWLYMKFGSGIKQPSEPLIETSSELHNPRMVAPNPDEAINISGIQEYKEKPLKEIVVEEKKCGIVKLISNDVEDPPLNVLLLHGAKMKAQLWVDIGTMSNLTAWGVGAFAVNIDWEEQSHCEDGAAYLNELIKQLPPNDWVIVSPSLSGRLSIPFILSPEALSHIVGYVPIAPLIPKASQTVEKIAKEDARGKMSIWYVYGEQDTTLGSSGLKFFNDFPPTEVYKIDGAGHMCYKDKPDEWHHSLKEMLDSLIDELSEED